MAHFADNASARIVVLVDPVAETHQPERVVPVLRAFEKLRNVADIADLIQHVEHGFVGTAMGRAPQRGDAGGDAGKRIGQRAAGQAHG